jgi:hypothetical protein
VNRIHNERLEHETGHAEKSKRRKHSWLTRDLRRSHQKPDAEQENLKTKADA